MTARFSLEDLNSQQKAAVSAPSSNSIMVFAGAGSGKTRALTYRIAWLCDHEGFLPSELLALTFTNKAAREMRARAHALLGFGSGDIWLGTFHSICLRMLRENVSAITSQGSLQVIDAAEQRKCLRRIMANLGVATEKENVVKAQRFVNHCKDQGFRANAVPEERTRRMLEYLRIYAAYEKECREGGVLDFSELILRCYEMFAESKDILAGYREDFRCLLVDEFQDTNLMQYAWLRRLSGGELPLFAVGDDDQSIYGWRGANPDNFNNFRRDFKPVYTYPLERNYRSTQTILNAANQVIKNNDGRFNKELWTAGAIGEPITTVAAADEQREASFVVSEIQKWAGAGRGYSDTAVLYRSNAQSRVLESALAAEGIPYRVYGGLRFFDRAVVKDATAYLCLLLNPDANHFLVRVINIPPRGIGKQKTNKLRELAEERECSLWQALEFLAREESGVVKYRPMFEFYKLIVDLRASIQNHKLAEQVKLAIEKSGLLAHHRANASEEGMSNVEHLRELVNAAEEADAAGNVPEGVSPLEHFLAQVTLQSDFGQSERRDNEVNVMTLHAAKGLEFPLVFMVGVEEELFPHARSLAEPQGLEEERRLCYVGMTRAKERLVISWCESRRMFGSYSSRHRSRFVDEIPGNFINELPAIDGYVLAPLRRGAAAAANLSVELPRGNVIAVRHADWGEGVVIAFAGKGKALRVQVRFCDGTKKWLVWNYAGLEVLNRGEN